MFVRNHAPVRQTRVVLNYDSAPLAGEDLLLAGGLKHVLKSMQVICVPLHVAASHVFQFGHQVQGVGKRRPVALHLFDHIPDQ